MPSIASEWIDLVLARSAELRKAGVLAIGCDGHSAHLAPLEAAPPAQVEIAKPDADNDYVGDPLNDPASYPGGQVPGFTIKKFDTGDDY